MSSDFEELRDPEIERKKRQKLLIDIIDAIRAAHIARLALARSLVVHKIEHGADGGMIIPARVDDPANVEEISSNLHPNAESTLFFMSMMYLPLIIAGIFVEPKTDYERYKKIFQLLDAVVWTGINLIRFNGAGAAAIKHGITIGLTPVASIILLLGGYIFDLLNQWYFDHKNKEDQLHYKADVLKETVRIQTLQDTLANIQTAPLDKLKALLTDDDSIIKKADHRCASDDAKAVEKELKTQKEKIRNRILDAIKEKKKVSNDIDNSVFVSTLLFNPRIQENYYFNGLDFTAEIVAYQEVLALEQINYEKSKKELQDKIDHFYNFSLRWNIAYAIGLSSGAALELILLTTAFGLAPLGFAVISGSTAINQIKNLIFTVLDYLDVRQKCQDKLAFINSSETRTKALAAKNNPALRAAFNQNLVALGLKPITDFDGDLNNYFVQANIDITKQQDTAFNKMCLHVSWYSFVLTTMACLIFVANPIVGFAVFTTCIIAYTAYKASERFELGPKGALIANVLLAMLIAAALIALSAATAGSILIPIAVATLAVSTSAFVGHNVHNVVKQTPVKKMISDFWNKSSSPADKDSVHAPSGLFPTLSK